MLEDRHCALESVAGDAVVALICFFICFGLYPITWMLLASPHRYATAADGQTEIWYSSRSARVFAIVPCPREIFDREILEPKHVASAVKSASCTRRA